ncbi:MAG: Holliday junction resolvase RuvX [bacterium]
MTRILALDWGTVRVGAALSDYLGKFASPYETFPAKPQIELFRRVRETVEKEEVERIIIGLPLNMDGSEGVSAGNARRFAELIRGEVGIPVEMVDERLSSFEAEHRLREIGRKPSRDKGRVDRAAAALLLQEYLDRHANGS